MRASNCIGECNDSKINNDHCDNENIRCKDDLESLSNIDCKEFYSSGPRSCKNEDEKLFDNMKMFPVFCLITC